MADKFRVGQRVRVIPPALIYIGEVFTIVEPSKLRRAEDPTGGIQNVVCYMLSNGFCSIETALEPVYDGEEKSNWSECSWKPSKQSVSVPHETAITNEHKV